MSEFLESFGEIPIPPCPGRDQRSIDHSRYQTVYGKHLGAVAASGTSHYRRVVREDQGKGRQGG